MKRLLVVLFLLIYTNTFAQKRIVSLSFNECLNIAVNNSNKLNASKLSVVQAKQQTALAKLSLIPSVAYSSSYGFMWGSNFNVVTNGRSPFSTQTTQMSLQLQLPIFQNGQKKIAIERSVNNTALLEEEFKDDRFQLSENVLNLYYTTLFYEEYLRILENISNNSFKQTLDNQIKYSQGAIAKDELLLANTSYKEDLNQVSDVKNNYLLSYAQLKTFIGIDNVSDSIVLQADTSIIPIYDTIHDSGINEIVKKTNQSIVQERLIDAKKLDLKLTTQKIYPQFFMSGSANTNYDKSSTYIFGPFNQQLKNNLGYYINFGVSFSFANLVTQKKNNQVARIEIEKQIETKKEVEKNLHLKVESMVISGKNFEEKVKNLRALSTDYEAIYNMSVEKLRYGKISQFDFYHIKNRYLEILSSYLSSRYDLILNNKTLSQYLQLSF